MYTLITFTSNWGSQHGGINAFNADFLAAMAIAYHQQLNVICVVNGADQQTVQQAKSKLITLISLPYQPADPHMGEAHAKAAITELNQQSIQFDADKTVWLGHDRISGQAALTAAKQAGGRAALIHHMSYDHYEAFAENGQTANDKRDQQEALFEQADILIAIGPTLRDALEDMVDGDINMLIPGLAQIEPKIKAPNTFSLFVSGRLSPDALKVKQGQLAVAAFAKCYQQAQESGQPDALQKRPKLLMRGVDFDSTGQQELHFSDSEQALQKFAEGYAQAVINLQPLPYTTDRAKLFKDLKNASVAAMPSWHEGFGLVAWEAIAAGVPLILSKDSGVYQLISEQHSGFEDALVESVKVNGQIEDPHFSPTDLTNVCAAITSIAQDPQKARNKALRLRSELLEHYSWAKCAEDVAGFFDWPLSKPQVKPQAKPQDKPEVTTIIASETSAQPIAGYGIPKAVYRSNRGAAISVLLRSNEEVVAFDPLRQPDLDNLVKWSTTSEYAITVRLITGEGGIGKTRLARELCHQLQQQHWTVGFLDKNRQQQELADSWQGLKASNKPCLIVVDYAETQSDQVINLLKLISSSDQHHPVCLLLLARDGGDWWDDLPAKDAATESIFTGYATSGPHIVPPLYQQIAQREQGYLNALDAFASELNLNQTTVMPDLSGEHFIKPLYIQMAALLALHGEQPTSADGITKAILLHEQRYWDAALLGEGINVSNQTAKKLLALVTLAGQFATAKQAQSYWQSADDNILSPHEFRRLFECLSPLYPASQGLQAIKPDLLGEALLTEVLSKSTGPALLSAVLAKSSSLDAKLHALTVLARLSLYKPNLDGVIIDAFSQHLTVLVPWIVMASLASDSRLPELTVVAMGKLNGNEQNSVAAQLSTLIQHDSVALNSLACEAYRIIYQKVKKKFAKKNKVIKIQAEYADALYNYAISLGYAGKSAEACVMGEQAVAMYCELFKQDGEKYELSYASSLANYSVYLSEIGRHESALEFDEKALVINKQLAEKNPNLYEGDYASSLSSRSIRLSNLGQYQQAIEYSEKALKIRERLAENNPDRYENDYARSLVNYSSSRSR